MAEGGMVLDMRVGETVRIDVLPPATLDRQKITITLRHKDGRRARLVVQADPEQVLIGRGEVATPNP